MKSVISSLPILGVLLTGTLVFWQGTDSGTAWTSEVARRVAVKENSIQLPKVNITNTNDKALNINQGSGVLLVDFIFTECPTICTALGSEFQWLQNRLDSFDGNKPIKLVSLTFDFENDGALELSQYLSRYSANQQHWLAGRFTHKEELDSLMRSMGVIAIPDIRFGFIHNAAIYLIVDGKLVDIFDIGEREKILAGIKWHSSQI